jgi:hypothetical protein
MAGICFIIRCSARSAELAQRDAPGGEHILEQRGGFEADAHVLRAAGAADGAAQVEECALAGVDEERRGLLLGGKPLGLRWRAAGRSRAAVSV